VAPAALGDVAQIRGEERFVVDLRRIDRELDQNFGAVAMNRVDLDATPDHGSLARLQKTRESVTMHLSQRRRNDQLGQLAPDRFLAFVTESLFGRGIE